MWLWFGVPIAVVVLVLLVVSIHHGSSDQSSAVAAAAGATSCSESGFTITTIAAGKQTVYDCTVNGASMCVTYHGGLASNSTVLVRLAFASTLGGSKPACLS